VKSQPAIRQKSENLRSSFSVTTGRATLVENSRTAHAPTTKLTEAIAVNLMPIVVKV
jgi:hypothetical protein